MKRLAGIVLVFCLAFVMTGYEEKSEKKQQKQPGKGSVYFLSNEIEKQGVYQEIAKVYQEKTGVKVTIRAVSEESYQEELETAMSKTNAPSLFLLQGIRSFSKWESECDDISDSQICEYLSDPTMAIWDSKGVYAIPQSVDGYGLVYNEEIAQRYLNLSNRQTNIMSMSQIRDFATLNQVVEDVKNHKKDLDIEGVFASVSMKKTERIPYCKYLLGAAMADEFVDNEDYDNAILAALATPTIEFKDSDAYCSLLDLYAHNGIVKTQRVKEKTIEDSLKEFATGQVMMLQTGNWNWFKLASMENNVLNSEKVKMLPIFTGTKGDSSRGICIGTKNYLAVNTQAKSIDREATLDFLVWLYGTKEGKNYVLDQLGYIAPFNTFSQDEIPTNPLAREVVRYMNEEGWKNVPWVITAFPGGEFTEKTGEYVADYLAGKYSQTMLVNRIRKQWEKESVATTTIKGYNGY